MLARWISSLSSGDRRMCARFVGAALLGPLALQLLSLVYTRIDFENMLYGPDVRGKLVTEPMGMMFGTLVSFYSQSAALYGSFGRHLDVLVRCQQRVHPLTKTYKLMIELSSALEATSVIFPPRAVQWLVCAARRRDHCGAACTRCARRALAIAATHAPAPPAPRGHSVSSVMPANALTASRRGRTRVLQHRHLILSGSGATQRLESGDRINADLFLYPYMLPDGDGSCAMLGGSKASPGMAAYCRTLSARLFIPPH